MADQRILGATSNTVRFKVSNSSTGAPAIGLTGSTSGLIISIIADVEATPVVYTQAASHIQTIAVLGVFAAPSASCIRFAEVDATNHPGLYEFQPADTRFNVSNATHLIISVSAAGVVGDYEIQLMPGALALQSSFTTLFNKLGAITGSGANNLLDYIRSILRNDVTASSDLGGTYSSATMSLQAAFAGSMSLANFFDTNSTKLYADAIPGSVVYEIATHAAGGGLNAQATRDAMKLAPTAGSPAAGSLDARLVAMVGADGKTVISTDVQDRSTTLTVNAGAGLTAQQMRDAMKLAPSGGSPAGGSIDTLISGRAVPGSAMVVSDKTNFSLTPAYDPAKTAAQAGDQMTLTAGELVAIANQILDMADSIETGLSVRGALRLGAAADAGNDSGMETGSVAIRNAVADSKVRITSTVDTNGNRSGTSVDVT